MQLFCLSLQGPLSDLAEKLRADAQIRCDQILRHTILKSRMAFKKGKVSFLCGSTDLFDVPGLQGDKCILEQNSVIPFHSPYVIEQTIEIRFKDLKNLAVLQGGYGIDRRFLT